MLRYWLVIELSLSLLATDSFQKYFNFPAGFGFLFFKLTSFSSASVSSAVIFFWIYQTWNSILITNVSSNSEDLKLLESIITSPLSLWCLMEYKSFCKYHTFSYFQTDMISIKIPLTFSVSSLGLRLSCRESLNYKIPSHDQYISNQGLHQLQIERESIW